ncbi:MAG TPA: type III-A CRISPR-associated RAMP protein Csm5 [Bryobacteraceae bacterium]|nr:type III-A CRISPR-associated RAMP protein Csm5 [Bryobacteraceae bacterium]
MTYRLTCLTPVLVGDGRRLSPIDYMVWKDQVNVLDQWRIFRLLAKGPRLDNYLSQLKRSEKLDFASWGGFAQNFADRRILFEHPSSTAHWERAGRESLQIPTFFSGPSGPYLPGSAMKGALRTGMMFSSLKEGAMASVAAQFTGDRPPRRPAEILEDREIGTGGASRTRTVGASDSAPVPYSAMRIYLLRVATLVSRGKDHRELAWKTSPRGSVDGRRPNDATPMFAEMAAPGTVFEGHWREIGFLSQHEIRRALNWREAPTRAAIFAAANSYAAELLRAHRQYTEWTGLSLVGQSVNQLESQLAAVRDRGDACLLSLGWGSGLLSKVAWLKTDDADYRKVITQTPIYGKSIAPFLPFPKTRRVIFLENRPAVLPGWALLEVQA